MKPAGVGALFPKAGHSNFMTLTGSRFDSMVARMKKKKLPPLGFSKDEFRAYVLEALGGHEDGAIQCRYCRKFCTLAEVTPDHEIPLSRGGDSHWSNLGFPCMNCNQAKGSLNPDEFLKLIHFLETELPLGRKDVLGRLAKANKLAAGAARVALLLKSGGRPIIKQQPKDELPPF